MISDLYLYYIRLDETDTVIRYFNSIFEDPLETDLLYETSPERHLSFSLVNEFGEYIYKYANGELVLKSDSELNTLEKEKENRILLTKSIADNKIATTYSNVDLLNISDPIEYAVAINFIKEVQAKYNEIVLSINSAISVTELNAINLDQYSGIIPIEITDTSTVNTKTGEFSLKKDIILSVTDITNGYIVIDTPATGDIGEKNFVRMDVLTSREQEYGQDFTAINFNGTDENGRNVIKLIIIWKTSGSILSEVITPVYPTLGIDRFNSGDKIRIIYK